MHLTALRWYGKDKERERGYHEGFGKQHLSRLVKTWRMKVANKRSCDRCARIKR